MKTIFVLLLMTTVVSAEELKWQKVPPDNMPVLGMTPQVTCFEVTGAVTGQKFFECPQLSKCPGDPDCPKIPDDAMKTRALKRGYELNNNSMVGGSIDVSQDPVVTGRTVITPETEFNVLDATPVVPEKKVTKQHK